MTQTKLAAVFFDLDGTLLDTALDLLYSLNYMLTKHGYNTISMEQLLPHISLGSASIIKNVLNLNVSEAQLEAYKLEFIAAYHALGHLHTDFFPGMKSLLEDLNSRNIPWGIITNKTTALTWPIAEILHFQDLGCKSIVCADTTDHAKPHPAPMLKACEDLNVDPKLAIFIGDARTDILAGKAVAMPTIAAGYGYLAANENINEWQADYVVSSVMELSQLLNKI